MNHEPLTILNGLAPLWGVCEHENRRVIMAAFPYRLPETYYQNRNISRYAVVRDYHAVCGARLERACEQLQALYPNDTFQWYCDNSSLPEVELAQRAGLGRQGRHNLLITEDFGSWVFLGEIVTTAALPITINDQRSKINCAACSACQLACPTGALESFSRSRCISNISQRKGDLTSEEAALLQQASTVWGCDLCQEACPHNQQAKIDPLPEFLEGAAAHITAETPLEGRAFAWRGKAVVARNLGIVEKQEMSNEHAEI